MVSEQAMLFSLIELKKNLGTLHTSETIKLPVTYMYMILSPFCVCNAKCVIISTSKYLLISTKFGTVNPQCNTSGCFFFEFSIFSVFIDIFSILGLRQ